MRHGLKIRDNGNPSRIGRFFPELADSFQRLELFDVHDFDENRQAINIHYL
jgi:hypothetical protein